MREPSDARNIKKSSLGSDRECSTRSSRSRSRSSTKSQVETERRIYVPNTPSRTTHVTGRLNAPPGRVQSTPIKSRPDNTSRSVHGALAKKSPARNSSRSRVGLSLNFRKATKQQSSLKSLKSIESTGSQISKGSAGDCGAVSVEKNRHQKSSKLGPTNSSIDKSAAEGEKKPPLSRTVSSGRRFGMALSFRKASKSQPDGSKVPAVKSDSPACDASGATSSSLESKERSERDIKFSDVPWLSENLKDVVAENLSLKEQIKVMEKELTTVKLNSERTTDFISPLMSKPYPLSSTILDETSDNYSLFDVSQHHDVATLQEQVSRLHENNVSTNEELQATLEELKDLRVKSNDLRLENKSLVGERKLLCESLCQQSERAQRFEQEMEVLKNLILSNLENPDDFQRRLAEIHRLVDLDRKSIMKEFDLLKENLVEIELELNETKDKISRLREDRNRWKAKYDHLKQLHAGYSSRLSSKSLSDQENQPPQANADKAWKARCRQQEAEIERLNDLVKFLESKTCKTESEATLASLRAEKDSALSELSSLREKLARDRRSWDSFQTDLLTAVRVAEAFRVTSEDDAKRLASDNEQLHAEIGLLRKQVEKLRRSGFGLAACPPIVSNSSVKAMVHNLEARIRQYGSNVGDDCSGRSVAKNGSAARHPFSGTQISNQSKDDGADDGTSIKDEARTLERSGDSATSVSKGFVAQDDDWFQEPLSELIRNGGSRRNALLQWCQQQAFGYKGLDITNFSSSWTDGLALCALIHSYRPDLVPYERLRPEDQEQNLLLAFNVMNQLGIDRCSMSPEDLVSCERPEWNRVMRLVTKIFCYFESGQRTKKGGKAETIECTLRQTRV